jgi:lipopolysaccharide/colanic/teichoic acid biosynthesis glycosyltransferase
LAKRLFDLLIASAALLLLWPVLLAAAMWIKTGSPGPVFFRQERVGLHGKPFFIHKFRTMHHGAQGSLLTASQDSRVTAAGYFLRRTRLDELPQLFDVLLGHMSLVGPRPEVPRFVAHYPAALRDRALAVRPGITDPASLQFADEATLLAQAAQNGLDPEHTYIHTLLPQKVAMAVSYAESATLATDIAVLWRTARLLVAKTLKQ